MCALVTGVQTCALPILSTDLVAGQADKIPDELLRDACILVWNFQHAMRPIQIANRNANHVRLRHSKAGEPIVHVTFRYAKQRPGRSEVRRVGKECVSTCSFWW